MSLALNGMTGRDKAVRFLDRGVELTLLVALVALPLGFPRFLVFLPLDELSFLIPKTWITNHTPLNLKESLATILALYGLALWAVRSILSGRLELIWTPLHYPFALIVLLAGVSLFRPVAFLLQARDFSLLLCYAGFVHLFLLYLWRSRRFRRRCMNLFFLAGAVFTAVVFAMDRGWYFGPFLAEVQDNRQALYATIGHNISVASYLMILTIYLLGRIAESRGWPTRLGCGLWAALCLHLIVAAQTVGVWLALVALCAVVAAMVFWFKKGNVLRQTVFRWAMIASALALIGFVGFFALDEMMGGRRTGSSSPMERLKLRTTPGIVQKGTRARLWTISLDLVRRHFPLGVGFSGFKYIYAEEQGRYFREHPDTPLVPTPLHTDRVHNDYLQVWVELGALGLAALIWAVFGLVKMQGLLLRSSRRRARDRLRGSIAFLAMAGVMLHLLTSFELHVASSALFFIFGLGLWVSEGRLGRLAVYPLTGLSRSLPVAMILSALTIVSAWGFAGMACRHVIADSFFWLGEHLRDAGNYPMAVTVMEKAYQLAPYRSNIAKQQGALLYRMAEEDVQRNRIPEAIAKLADAEKLLTVSMSNYRHKEQNYYRARIRQLIATLTGRSEYFDLAVQDYNKVIEIYPMDLLAYYELGRLYYGTGRVSQAVEVWRRAQKYEYEFMRDYHVKDAEIAIKQGRRDLAIQYYQLAVLLSPKNSEYYLPLMDLFLQTERYAEGVKLGEAFLDFYPRATGIIARVAEFELKAGHPERAEEWLDRILQIGPVDVDAAWAGKFCFDLLNRKQEGLAWLERWRQEHPRILVDRQEYRILMTLDAAYEEQGKTAERIALWTGLLELPDDLLYPYYRSRCHYKLARIYLAQGRLAETLREYEAASRLPVKRNDFPAVATLKLIRMFEWPLLF
jgi:tetratricopeptide (TPR) repeat protein/O-antigen ligase